MFDLSGRVVLVTGGGQGVGAAIARTMASYGAAVVVNDLAAERAERVVGGVVAAGGRAVAAAGDVTSEQAIDTVLSTARRTLGPVDVLVNNAGLPASGLRRAAFAESCAADWAPMIDLNLHAVLLCSRAVLGEMIDQRWGRIITIVSDAGRVGEPGMAAYSAAKAGAMGFTRALAGEVGPAGVTCNCLSLGTIAPGDATTDPALVKQAQRYPLRRLGRPDDVAGAALWLASAAADWVTGQTVSVNGGYVTS